MASVGKSVFATDKLHVLNISICREALESSVKTPSKHGSELWADFSWSTPENVQGESCGSRYGHTAVSFQNGESTNILVFGGFPKVNKRSGLTVYCGKCLCAMLNAIGIWLFWVINDHGAGQQP